MKAKELTLKEKATSVSRKGIVLFDVLAGIVLGLVLTTVVAVSVDLFVKSKSAVEKEVQDYSYKTAFDQILYLMPYVKTTTGSSNSVELDLYNGCVVTISYDSGTKEVSFSKTCPQGEDVSVPGQKVKVDTFDVSSDSSGVSLKLCNGDDCSLYYLEGM